MIVKKDTTATAINGIKRWYPPVSSAMRKMPVSGACMTPAIKPDIPAKAKLASGTPRPIIFIKRAQIKPTIAPINSDGAKIPPTPPPPLVATEANILKNTMAAK